METLTIPPHAQPAARHLYANSALANCVTADEPTFTTVRPVAMLSSGEQILWRALTDLAERGDITFATNFDACQLDRENQHALAVAGDMVRQAVG